MTAALCPYLLAEDGGWRASTAAREHRCTAVLPSAVLAPDKQRRLCLVADHSGCATFQAASGHGTDGSSASRPERAGPVRAGSRSIARTAPLVLDHGRVAVSVPALRSEPRLGQFILIGLMAIAFAAILLARLPFGGTASSGGADGPGGVSTASPRATAGATLTAAPTDAPSVTDTPTRTLVPTEAKPTAPPAASADPASDQTSYKVRRGDTLSGIATEFGTTWQVLAEINDIRDPSSLRVGQVLQLP